MVHQSKKGASTSKTSKSTAAATTSSTAKSKVTSSSTSTSSSNTKTSSKTSSSNVVDNKNSGSQSSVVISEVVGGPSHLVVSPTEYVVTQPEIVQKSKEHYIYGGTQIVELGTSIGADLIHHEKNQSAWDGKFIYEGGKPGQTIKTITSRSAIITEPVGTETTVHTTSSSTKYAASSDLVKHESDFLKHAATTSKTTTLSSQTTGRDAIDSSVQPSSSSSTSTIIRSEKWTDGQQQVRDSPQYVSSSPRNKGNWDGSFTYETTTVKNSDSSAKDESNISKQTSSNTQSVHTTRDTTDSTSHGRPTAPSKIQSEQLIDDQRHVKRDAQKLSADKKGPTPDGKLFTYVKGQSVADSTDQLLESERCIAKKAYVTTDDTDEIVDSSKSVRRTYSTDAEPRKTYPVSTLDTHTGRVTDKSKVLRDSDNVIVESKRGDTSDQFTSEEFSHSFSTSSTVEKTTSSSQVIEIVDGKERIAKETFNESGASQSKSAEEKFKARSGTGITPTLEYDQKLAEENITYKNDKPGKKPIFDRNYMDAERNVRMIGKDAPIEHTRGTYETTRFDDKTKKYITDVRHSENDRQLDSNRRITDSIQGTTHGVAPNGRDNRPGRYTTTTTSDTYDRQLHDKTTKESQSIDSNIVDTSSTNYVQRTRLDDLFDSKNITDTSTTFTSKVFDDNTNTWRVVNESTINEKNVLASPKQRPTPSTSPLKSTTHPGADNRVSTTKHIDKRSSDSSVVKSSTESNTISQQLYDEKSKSWREVDERTIKSKRPSLVRYVSKDNEGKYTTIYKRKLFDRRSGTWKVVDEKVYRNNNFNEHIPEVMEDVTNVTTTTYTTKVFDTKTNTWKVVDEKTFTDHQTQVPKDIADEIAKDQPDIANITTTTELTKVSWAHQRNHLSFILFAAQVILRTNECISVEWNTLRVRGARETKKR